LGISSLEAMNVLNELRNTIGVLWWPAIGSGAIGMVGAPILAFLSLKGRLIDTTERGRSASKFFRSLGALASTLAGVAWLGSLLSIFPGVFFCSVYCFLGLALPILGVLTASAYLLLVVADLLSSTRRNSSAYLVSLPLFAMLVGLAWLLAPK
jgi:hypothetical protein